MFSMICVQGPENKFPLISPALEIIKVKNFPRNVENCSLEVEGRNTILAS
jgi:hypothetical protein